MVFLLLMVHRLLVMQERIARIGLENGGSICVHCKKSQRVPVILSSIVWI